MLSDTQRERLIQASAVGKEIKQGSHGEQWERLTEETRELILRRIAEVEYELVMESPSEFNQEQIEYIKNEMQDVKFYKRDGFINMMKSLREQVAGNEVTEFMKRDATTEFNMLQNRRNINFIEHFPHFHELIRK